MCLAVPGQVRSTYEQDGLVMGRVDFGGVVKNICLSFVPEISVGEYVIVHVGFAIQKLDELEAERALQAFRAIASGEETAENDHSIADLKEGEAGSMPSRPPEGN